MRSQVILSLYLLINLTQHYINMFAQPSFPKEIFFEVTNACNLNCAMCARSKMQRKIGYMPFDLFCKAINQIKHLPQTIITMHGLGEPLMHPELPAMIRYAKSLHFRRVSFNTNGLLLNPKMMNKLINSGLDHLTFSLDSATARFYNPDCKADLSLLDKKIVDFVARRNKLKSHKPKIKLQFVYSDSTREQALFFKQKWKNKVDRVILKRLLRWPVKVHRKTKPKTPVRIICANQMLQAVIQWNGQVISCCLSKENFLDTGVSLGNLYNTSLKEIFIGENRQRLLKDQFRGDYRAVPSCINCPEWVDYFAPLLFSKGSLRQRLQAKATALTSKRDNVQR